MSALRDQRMRTTGVCVGVLVVLIAEHFVQVISVQQAILILALGLVFTRQE